MNKVYKSVFNVRTGTYVAVSELTKAQGKSAKAGITLASIVTAATLGAWGGAADAQSVIGIQSNGAGGLAIVQPVNTTNSKLAIAIGDGQVGSNVSGSFNIAMGHDAGHHVTGDDNIAIGNTAGVSVSGLNNNAFGGGAGQNVTGSDNTSVGNYTGVDVSGKYNSAFGYQSGGVVRGNMNMALGDYDAGSSVTGDNNLAIGHEAGRDVSGDRNQGMGYTAGNQVVGLDNTAIGRKAGNRVVGSENINMGYYSGYESTGDGNISIGNGVSATFTPGTGSSVSGNNNMALGNRSGTQVSGESNAVFGYGAGSNVSGNKNLGLGAAAGSLVTGKDNVALGSGAGFNVGSASSVSSSNVAIGTGAGTRISGSQNTAIGWTAGHTVSGSDNIGIGSGIGKTDPGAGTEVTGFRNTALGLAAGRSVSGNSNLALGETAGNGVSGFSNNAIGYMAGQTVSGSNNSTIGRYTGASVTGNNNVAFGGGPSEGNSTGGSVTGDDNASVGTIAGFDVSGGRNVSFGYAAGRHVTGSGNVGVGSGDTVIEGAGSSVSGLYNAAIGYGAGRGVRGDKNAAIGTESGFSVSGTANVGVGYGSGNYVTGSENAAFGAYVGADLSGANNLSMGTYSGNYTSGERNNAIGYGAGTSVSGTQNSSMGYQAGVRVTGTNNISYGNGAAKLPGPGSYVSGTANIAFGQQTGVYIQGDNNTSLGTSAGRDVTGASNISIGTQAGGGVSVDNTISLGTNAKASKADAIAIGTNSVASGVSSIAIGKGSVATGSVAVGLDALAGGGGAALGDYADAGGTPTSVNPTNTLGTAIGNAAVSSHDGAVALGASSTTTTATPTSSAVINGVTYSGFAGTTPTSVVSVGSAGAERQITNVAAGQISATSTDAINGSQLYAGLSTAIAGSATHYYSVNDGGTAGGNYFNDGATATGALAAGLNTSAAGTRAVAIGDSATANGENTIYMGYAAGNGASTGVDGRNAIGIGYQAGQSTSGTTGVAIGYQTGRYVSGQNNLSMGRVAGNSVSGGDNIAFGNGETAGMGAGSVVTGNGNLALGYKAGTTVSGNSNYGIGQEAGSGVRGNLNTSIGSGAGQSLSGQYNVGVGVWAAKSSFGENNVGMGTAAGMSVSGNSNIAIGNQAGVSVVAANTTSIGNAALASKDDAVAVGSKADASKVDAVAIGRGATASVQVGDVALGAGSKTAAVVNTTSATINSVTYGTFAGTNATSTVSVGDVGSERTITNVAAGRISATSTDAINGSQLYVGLSTAIAGSAIHYTSVNDGGTAGGNYNNDGATAVGAIASGVGTTATATNAAAIGSGATAGTANSVALGAGSTTAPVNTGTLALYGGTAAGVGSDTFGTVSVGTAAAPRQVQNVAAGVISSSSTDAINGSQLYSVTAGIDQIATDTANYFGGGSTYNTTTGDISAPTYQVIGGSVTNVGDAITNIITQGPVQYSDAAGTPTPYTPSNNVTLVGVAPGDLVTIHNVEAGVADTDAVNVSQLSTTVAASKTKYYSVNSTSGTNENNDGATGLDAIASGKNASSTGVRAISMGLGATASAADAVALGAGAIAGTGNSVALGAGSTTGAVHTGTLALYGGTAAGVGSDTFGTVSVGTAAAPRQVQNVAAGVISASSTDAINGSQLYTVTTGVNQIATYTANYFGGGSTYNTTTGDISAPTYQVIGGSVTNVGDAITNIITQGPVQYSDAAGTPTPYTPSNNVTLVGVAPGDLVTIHNVEAGVADTDAVNVSQLSTTVAASKTKYYSVNSTSGTNENNDGATGLDAIASGKNASSTGVRAISMGLGATATAADAVALGAGAIAGTGNSVALGAGSTTSAVHTGTLALYGGTAAGVGSDTFGTVSVGTAAAPRQVQNVAAGVISASSTDAINGSQLYTVTTGVNQIATYTANYFGGGSTYNTTTGDISAPTYQVIGGSVTNVGDAITNIITQGPLQYSDAAGNPNPYVVSNDVTLVGTAPGALVTIHNLAAGVADTDAVNVSQLNSTVAASKTHYYSVNDGGTAGGNYNNDGATATGAIASGVGTTATAVNATAIGSGATANTANSVALGAGSTTSAIHTGQTGLFGGTAAGVATAANGTVSVGTVGGERQVQNVAAGVVSSTSTDAVNGSQLYTVASGVTQLGNSTANYFGGGSTYNSVTGAISAPTYQVIGGSVTNVGDAITNIITQGPVQYSDAAGTPTPYTPSNNVTLVGLAPGDLVTVHNVAAGVAGTDAVNVSQLSTAVADAKTKYVGINSTGGSNVNGEGASGMDAIATGKDAVASATNAVAIGLGATASTANSVALGAGSTTGTVHTGTLAMYGGTAAGVGSDTYGVVSVGTAGAPRQIQNVAAGVISGTSTDAINGSQLYSVTTGVNNLGSSTATALGGGSTYNSVLGTVSAPTYQVIGGTATTVGAAITNIITQGPVQYADATGAATPYTPSNTVTLVGATADPVTLTNVAPGAISPTSTDAVNGSQLYATNYYISAVDNRVTMVDNRVTQVDNRVTVLDNQTVKYDLYQDGSTNYNSVTLGGGKSSGPVGLHNVADGVAPTDAVNVSQLNAQGKKIYGAVAAAAALESAPYIPGKLTSAAGIATAGGQSAIGISIRKTADNARWSLSAGLAYSPGVSKTPVARAAITNIWD